MFTLKSVALVAATILGTPWLVDTWRGEERRFWVAMVGLASGYRGVQGFWHWFGRLSD